MANNDLRQQILVSLRAEGIGEADKAREAMANIVAEIRKTVTAFSDGSLSGEEYQKTLGKLTTSLNFFASTQRESRAELEAIDVGLHKLQMTAIKFGDDYAAAMTKAAQATEDLALKEAEALAKVVVSHEQFLAREAAAMEAGAVKKDELLAREIAAEVAAAERKAAADAEAVTKEEQRFNRMMQDRQNFLERQAAAEAAADLKEAERLARLAAGYEQHLEREEKAAVAAQQKKDELLAREIAAEVAAQQKQDALDAKEVMEEDARFNKMMMDRQEYYDRVAEAQRKASLRVAEGKDGMELAAGASQKFGVGVLNLSHGLQDLQYGFGAFLNNIPLIVQSMGAGPGLAGTIMLVGVGFELLKPKLAEAGQAIQRIGRHFSTTIDPAKKMGDTVQDLKDKLEALEKKPNKVALDYYNIEQAEKKLAALEAKLESFNSHVKDATPLQEKVAKEVDTIITEYAGGTDEKSGTQNLLDLIESAKRGRGNTKLGGEFLSGQEGFEKFTQRSETRQGILDRQSKGEFYWGEDSMLKDLNKEIPELEQALVKGARDKIKATIEDARSGKDSAIRVIANEFGRKPQAFLAPGGGLAPVDPEFGAMLESARGPNILAREEEEAAEKRQESMMETDELIRKNRKARNKQNEAAKKLALDQTAGLDAANLKDFNAWKELEGKKATDAKKAATVREQQVKEQATLFGGQFDDQHGPGSLDAAIIGRAGRGQTAEQIQGDLAGTMRGQLAGEVPEELVGEVADAIVKKAVDTVRAEVAAAGGGQAGIAEVAGERADKLNRAAGAAANRDGREQVGQQEMGMAEEIFNAAGGGLNEQGAMTAAHRAMKEIREGTNAHQAMLQSMTQMMNEVAQGQMQFRAQMNGMQGQIRQGRAQRPGLLPFFGQ